MIFLDEDDSDSARPGLQVLADLRELIDDGCLDVSAGLVGEWNRCPTEVPGRYQREIDLLRNPCKLLILLVRPGRLERPTYRFVGRFGKSKKTTTTSQGKASQRLTTGIATADLGLDGRKLA